MKGGEKQGSDAQYFFLGNFSSYTWRGVLWCGISLWPFRSLVPTLFSPSFLLCIFLPAEHETHTQNKSPWLRINMTQQKPKHGWVISIILTLNPNYSTNSWEEINSIPAKARIIYSIWWTHGAYARKAVTDGVLHSS